MNKNKIITFKKPGEFLSDPLTEWLRNGARKLITDAVEVELQQLLSRYDSLKNEQGRQIFQQPIGNIYEPRIQLNRPLPPCA